MSRSKEYKPVNNDDAIESNPKNITSVNFYPAIAFVGFCLSVFVTTLLLLLNYFGAIDLSGFTSQNSSNKNSGKATKHTIHKLVCRNRPAIECKY
jgi:hypothetical protein